MRGHKLALATSSYLARHRKLDEAVAILERYLERDPNNLRVIKTLAKLHIKRGMPAQAADLLASVLGRNPTAH